MEDNSADGMSFTNYDAIEWLLTTDERLNINDGLEIPF